MGGGKDLTLSSWLLVSAQTGLDSTKLAQQQINSTQTAEKENR